MTDIALPGIWTPPKKILTRGPWRPGSAFEELLPHLDKDLGDYLKDLWMLMAGSKTNLAENAVKDNILGGVAIGTPGTWFMGLWTTAGSLTDASTGSAVNETTYGSYARVSKTNNTTNFSQTGDNTSNKNLTAITFPTSTSGSQTVNQCGLTSASTAGNMWLWADLTAARTIDTGETPEFAVNAFELLED